MWTPWFCGHEVWVMVCMLAGGKEQCLTPWHTGSAGTGSPFVPLAQKQLPNVSYVTNVSCNLLAFKTDKHYLHASYTDFSQIYKTDVVFKNSVNKWRQ